ncbi:MAG: hypothetical protein ACOX5R_17590 [bacterium]|jgi:hypothetical protein
MASDLKMVYCHCQYARVISPQVKQEILEGLSASDIEFHAVPDLCELASRKDPVLHKLAQQDSLYIVACYPRAVKALFRQAGENLPERTVVLNMQQDSPDAILQSLPVQPAATTEGE